MVVLTVQARAMAVAEGVTSGLSMTDAVEGAKKLR